MRLNPVSFLTNVMDINKRISENDFIDNEDTYLDGLLWISILLLIDLRELLKEENRYRGIVISYFNSIILAFSGIELNEENTYGTILYLIKPLIISEYKKLRKRKVTKADCMIVLVKKILEIPGTIDSYRYNKNIVSSLKVITRLFDNIKNPGKNIGMNSTVEAIKSFLSQGITGKYSLSDFSIEQEENKITENNEISGSGIKIDEEDAVWKDEL